MRNQLIVVSLAGLALAQVCCARSRGLRDELKQLRSETGLSVSMFERGTVRTAPTSPKKEWESAEIPGAVARSVPYEGMLSPDGSLAAFPDAELLACPPQQKCVIEVRSPYTLAVAHVDGSGIRNYSEFVLPSQMCWSRDNSKLALVTRLATDPQPRLIVLDLASGRTDLLGDGRTVALTPQCWSQDGKELVYFVGDHDANRPGAIRISRIATHASRELLRDNARCKKDDVLCASAYPTWSPDGEWIAFLQEKTYWAIHPSGAGRKALFRSKGALSPLQWSPDMRFALYANCCALRDTLYCMCEIGRIHVRRLSDNADLEISGDGYQDMFIPRWTWIQKRPQ